MRHDFWDEKRKYAEFVVSKILKFFDIHFDIHLALNLVCASLKCRLSTIFVCLYISLEN